MVLCRLRPPPTEKKINDNYNVMSIAEKSVNQMKVNSAAKPALPAQTASRESKDPSEDNQPRISTIAEDSIKFLFSGLVPVI